MSNGGLTADLASLVTDIRWTKFRMKEGGLLELENDIDMLLSSLSNESVEEEDSLYKDLQILRKHCVCLGVRYIRIRKSADSNCIVIYFTSKIPR